MYKWVSAAGRIFIVVTFLFSSITYVMDFANIQKYMATNGVPFTAFFLGAATLLLVGCSVLILIGYKIQWGAIGLIIFMVVVTLIFHRDVTQASNAIHFTKNLSIIGGLLLLTDWGKRAEV